MNWPAEITGRDGYIIRKALAYAIAVIPHLPDEYQELSDWQDMKLIMSKMADSEFFLSNASEAVAHIEDSYRTHGSE